jgi:hypothetical protein
MINNSRRAMSDTGIVVLIAAVVLVIAALALSSSIYENVKAGTYHITQAPISGEVRAHMTPGGYWQNFADVHEWPISSSYEFTDPDADGPTDDRITVTFNDGATARLSGTIRIDLPRSEQEATDLIVKHGFRTFTDLENKLFLRYLRNVLNMTANLMSSRDSYSERRADFIRLANDQLENGIYITKDEAIKVIDPVTGTEGTKITKVIVMENGHPKRDPSVITSFGLRSYGLEIKDWHYEDRVVAQMKSQQEAVMAVQTAKAKSLQAEQEAKTVEAQGRADVMKVKYVAEQTKEKATVEAQREAAVATIAGQKEVDVAKLNAEKARIEGERMKTVAALELDAAKLQAQRTLELAQAEAKSRELILAADGALDKKLATFTEVNGKWAEAFANQKVPGIVMGGSGDGRNAVNFMDILGAKAAKDLALEMSVAPPATTK